MKKQLFIVASLCLALTACDHRGERKATHDNQRETTHTNQGNTTSANYSADPSTNNRGQTNYSASYPADNTGRNVRDRSDTITPMDQSENEMDRTITQKIRRALMQDDSLSTNAKNVKVMTSDGTVVLRGAVNSEREKSLIEQKARGVNGVRNVTNQLEVARSETAR